MKITFEAFSDFHFPLMLKWLQASHVKAWWDKDIEWTEELLRAKYGSYTQGYVVDNGLKKPIKAFVICVNDCSVGYIQLYNPYDFEDAIKLSDLPVNSAGIDIFIGENDYLRRGVASVALEGFLKSSHCANFAHALVDPDIKNSGAIRFYEKISFSKAKEVDTRIWMVKELKTSFTFNAQNLEKIKEIIKKYPANHSQSAVMPLLDLAQRQNGNYLSGDAIEAVAKILNMPPIRVFEVASFYSMYNLRPVGKHRVQVCGTTPCMLRGAEEILKTCEHELGIAKGEVTADGNFSIAEVECLGACVNAPIVQINDDYYEDLSVDALKSIIVQLKECKTPKTGSQTGRQCSKAAS